MKHTQELSAEMEARSREAGFRRYRPYGHPDTLWPDGELLLRSGWGEWTNKPWQLEFHSMGAVKKERAIIAGIGTGKSYPASYETACHMLGDYPEWWTGWRFDRPVKVWVAAIDADQQREGVQTHLLGRDLEHNLGSGFIPGSRLGGKPRVRQAGISEIADRFTVRHASGGWSIGSFKTFAQGWRSFQAAAPDIVQFDEEPDERDAKQGGVFDQMQSRVFRSGGLLYGAMTPELGETDITRHFMMPKHHAIGMVSGTWEDAPHLDKDERERLAMTYPDHKAQTKMLGLPMMGEGRVFSSPEDDLRVQPFEIPRHFAQIAGIDFGLSSDKKHPTAGVWLAWDRHKDVLYLIGDYRKPDALAVVHAEAFKRRGKWIPVAWPHDGHKRDAGFGVEIKDHYVSHGVNMLPTSARYDKDRGGRQDPEPAILDLVERMEAQRFLVFSNCKWFWEEYLSWHRRDGKPVAYRDDVMKALLYAIMMLRYAYTEPAANVRRSSSAPSLRMGM